MHTNTPTHTVTHRENAGSFQMWNFEWTFLKGFFFLFFYMAYFFGVILLKQLFIYYSKFSFCVGFIRIFSRLAYSYVTERCELTSVCGKLCDELIYLFVYVTIIPVMWLNKKNKVSSIHFNFGCSVLVILLRKPNEMLNHHSQYYNFLLEEEG